MSTQSELRPETPQRTPVGDLPPLHVVTEGIPASEHVEVRAAEPPAVRRDDARTRRIILALEAFLVLLILGSFAVGMTQVLAPAEPGPRGGVTNEAWVQYRVAE